DPNFRHLPPGGMAQWLHYQIVARVKELFPENPKGGTTWFVDKSGMFHLNYGRAEITFKKLDQDFQRSNYPTHHNEAYSEHKLPPGIEPYIKLIVGYQWADETATAIKRVAVVCPLRWGAEWWFELPAPAEGKGAAPRLAPELGPDAVSGLESKGFTVRGKKGKDKRKGRGDDKAAGQ